MKVSMLIIVSFIMVVTMMLTACAPAAATQAPAPTNPPAAPAATPASCAPAATQPPAAPAATQPPAAPAATQDLPLRLSFNSGGNRASSGAFRQ